MPTSPSSTLTNADGVGHGFPYRAVPPPGVIGWYEDLAQRAAEQQPELADDIAAAKASVESFHAWLVENRPAMTGQGGVGEDNFNWYLKHVKLMPYNTDQIVTLGLRELDRLWSVLALEKHRNRDLPVIELPKTAEEYAARIAETDQRIRTFLVERDIITESRTTWGNSTPMYLGSCVLAGPTSGNKCNSAIPRPTICMPLFRGIVSMAWSSATTPTPSAARSPRAPAPRVGASIWRRGS